VKVTPEKKIAFCAALAASGGSVARACQAIDVARLTAYRWRDADPEFAKEWEAAKAAGLDALEDEALRRAYEGYDKPIVHQGVITDTVREYSDTLAIFLLKGGKPQKYRDNAKVELTGPDGGPVRQSITICTGVPRAEQSLDDLV
jgi:transposase-like protein